MPLHICIPGTQTHDAENSSAQIYTCMYNSLSLEARLKVSTDSASSAYPAQANPAVMVASGGACFQKLIVTRFTVDTSSTIATIRRTFNSLDEYMLLVNCNIEQFNLHAVQHTA
mgnify:CR=1 FL=1